MRWRWPLLLCFILGLGAWFRLLVVQSWHAPAGDGMDFHQLSQELRLRGRFAYGPPPQPLSYGRLPGYPLFLAHVAVREAPLGIAGHVVKATRANVFLDLGTALLVFLILRELGVGRRGALAGLVATLLCPMLVLLSCYALTETLATFLGALALYLALRARRAQTQGGRPLPWAALCGAVAGLGQLVRADTLTLLPSLAILVFAWGRAWEPGGPPARPAPPSSSSSPSWPRRLLPVGLMLGCAGLVFSPWPARNLLRFGEAHPAGARWRTRPAGTPLPPEPVSWMRTFGDGGEGDGYLDLIFVAGMPLLPTHPGIFMPKMCDGPAQCERTRALFLRYNREGLSPPVRAEFAALAAERAAAHPVRTWVLLPLLRVRSLWRPLPEWELPLRAPMLGLPQRRWVFAVADGVIYALAALGAALLVISRSGSGSRSRSRSGGAGPRFPVAAALVLPAVLRTAMYAYLIPAGINQRYLVEIFPLLIILGVSGLSVGLAWLLSLRRQPGPQVIIDDVRAGPS
jgi:hypothetical protein